ncbi:hypothetical protein [Citrobacter phage CVT22]|uniref:Uncharacterized protein n=1 Tax=Citrobacter phage CVT22 TaxID=1622234 RepID=A0A0R6CPT0_9CAUD|nr:hypothetical protein APL39_gp02 [Citrobacter phage CVT22]AJT60707.1 hypothetical protein [Citrobacter phage CVT22]
MIDKSKMKASNGVPLTQGLFLEIGYTDFAVFTTKDEDYDYNGKTYPSLKRLYLEMEDLGEYEFATTYLLGWNHWQRMCANKQILKYIEEWRYELELKLRSRAIKTMKDKIGTEQGINAAKWIAEKGWDKKAVGRPNKQEEEREKRMLDSLDVDWAGDLAMLTGSK